MLITDEGKASRYGRNEIPEMEWRETRVGVEQTSWSVVGQFRIPWLWVVFLIKN